MSHDGHPYHMAQMPEGERIAILEANERNMSRRLDSIDSHIIAMNLHIAAINKTLSEMSGGKKAALGIFALIGTIIGAFGTLFGQHFFGPK